PLKNQELLFASLHFRLFFSNFQKFNNCFFHLFLKRGLGMLSIPAYPYHCLFYGSLTTVPAYRSCVKTSPFSPSNPLRFYKYSKVLSVSLYTMRFTICAYVRIFHPSSVTA